MKNVLLIVGVMTLFLTGCWDQVDFEFAKLKSDLCIADKQPVTGDKDWYQVYRVSDSEIDKVMKTDFSKYGYGSWKPFHHWGSSFGASFGACKIYKIAECSVSNEWGVVVMKKIKGRAGRGGEIAVYIDRRNGELLLNFGITD